MCVSSLNSVISSQQFFRWVEYKFQIEVPWTSKITFSQVQLFEPLALRAIRCSMSLSHPAGMPLTGDLGESWLQQIVPKRVVLHSRAGMCKRGFPISRAKSYNPQTTERTIRLSSLIHTKKKQNQPMGFFWVGHWQKKSHVQQENPFILLHGPFSSQLLSVDPTSSAPASVSDSKRMGLSRRETKKTGSEVVLCWTYIVTSRKYRLDNGYGALVV